MSTKNGRNFLQILISLSVFCNTITCVRPTQTFKLIDYITLLLELSFFFSRSSPRKQLSPVGELGRDPHILSHQGRGAPMSPLVVQLGGRITPTSVPSPGGRITPVSSISNHSSSHRPGEFYPSLNLHPLLFIACWLSLHPLICYHLENESCI